jgi:hypothetical protein
MYVFDTNIFITLQNFYPSRFPTIWNRINKLTDNGELLSLREVWKELEIKAVDFIIEWMEQYRHIFRIPTNEECMVVSQIFQQKQYQGLVRRDSILKGLPVADPFVIALAKVNEGCVVTQESLRLGGARIPTVCLDLKVECINLEGFLEKENLKY